MSRITAGARLAGLLAAAPTRREPAPVRLQDTLTGPGLLAGAANVIMQLSWPEVGYGVVESRVDSGNLFRHPVKRTRTTLTYLAVAVLGDDTDRAAYRRAVNTSHAQVRSGPSSPVAYNAFDQELQLWVAACLYRGLEDVQRLFGERLEPEDAERLYRESAVLGTTLQVRPERWPADRDAFERYWLDGLERVAIDDTVREHLTAVMTMKWLPAVISRPLGPFNRFVTTGFLPPRFREQMHLSWSPARQRRFERCAHVLGAAVRRLPGWAQAFPYNVLLWDLRRRIRAGRPLV
jgi:uncharacterized protein (DUF2236 family)